MDVTDLILDDHRDQRRLFSMIEQVPRDDVAALGALWGRLRALLDTHAEAEERYFYPRLLAVGTGAGDADSAADETEDAIKDHNELRDAAMEVSKYAVGSDEWFAAVDKANEVNSDHMAEEERQGLPDFRRHASLEERHALAVRFATFEAQNLAGVEPVDKDPAKYVKEQKEE